MAPQLIHSKKQSRDSVDALKYDNIKKKMMTYQKFIKDNFKYVGKNFAFEARSIHYDGKKKTKNIYGSASKKDLKELKEEGIKVQMMPWIEDVEN